MHMKAIWLVVFISTELHAQHISANIFPTFLVYPATFLPFPYQIVSVYPPTFGVGECHNGTSLRRLWGGKVGERAEKKPQTWKAKPPFVLVGRGQNYQ